MWSAIYRSKEKADGESLTMVKHTTLQSWKGEYFITAHCDLKLSRQDRDDRAKIISAASGERPASLDYMQVKLKAAANYHLRRNNALIHSKQKLSSRIKTAC